MTSTAIGLVETALKNCPEPHVNSGVSELWLPLLHQNCPPEPLDLGCLHLGQVLQLSTLGNSDSSVHPVHSNRDLTDGAWSPVVSDSDPNAQCALLESSDTHEVTDGEAN